MQLFFPVSKTEKHSKAGTRNMRQDWQSRKPIGRPASVHSMYTNELIQLVCQLRNEQVAEGANYR